MNLLFGVLMLANVSLAPLLHASQWIGQAPAATDLSGKVVLVDVFTYSCINCKHVVPELQRLRERYGRKDLEIVGIHTPELPSDHVRSNVVQNLSIQGITWPVAIDNQSSLWNAYGIQYWPTQMIFDRNGTLRKVIIGEGHDDEVSATVRSLVNSRPRE
jgi:thiol-disulfide isomerase/thioredoxin